MVRILLECFLAFEADTPKNAVVNVKLSMYVFLRTVPLINVLNRHRHNYINVHTHCLITESDLCGTTDSF